MMWLVSVLLYCSMQVINRQLVIHSFVPLCSRDRRYQTQIDLDTTNYPLLALLLTLNLIVLACDLAEVNQVYHYTIFALLGFASASRFAYLGYNYPQAVSPQVRRQAIRYFLLGVLSIVTGFAVSFIFRSPASSIKAAFFTDDGLR